MKTINKQSVGEAGLPVGKQRSYAELVECLNKQWNNQRDLQLTTIKKLDAALGSLSTKLNTILVAGSNGKSLTINFVGQLLREEGLSVGTFYTPHILTYNERFAINGELISHKQFTDIGNEVINTAESLGLAANSLDILTAMALLYFHRNKVDVAILEVSDKGFGSPSMICTPQIAAITRVLSDETDDQEESTREAIHAMLTMVKNGTHVISADQSKLNLQTMLTLTRERGGKWAMPIRKLAALPYPFEQLHGRCAALAERVAQIYINDCLGNEQVIVSNTMLTKQKGQRGRPTLEAKRQSELNPKRTVEQFWKETYANLPGRFQLLDKEKPSILLDNATNLDAFKNLLLGIRLLHYQRPLKGLTLVLGCDNPQLNVPEFMKLLRYFFKKTSGSVVICPATPVAGCQGNTSWNVDHIINELKPMKVKARAATSLEDALEHASKSVDERQGLVVIAGSTSLVNQYWDIKGIKRLS